MIDKEFEIEAEDEMEAEEKAEEQFNELEIQGIEMYEHDKEIIIVHNIEVARPQRTWGSFPEWFRPASMFHRFDGQVHDNSFVLVIYNGLDYEEAEIQEALKSFPDIAEIIRIRSYKDEQGDNQKTN